MRKFNIVKIGWHCCIRLQKQAIALLNRGHKVHIVGHKLPAIPDFTTSSQYANVSQLRETLRLHKDADIIHVHNEPSWMVLAAKEILPDIPIVLDVHDSMIFRSTEVKYRSAEERITFDVADGMVFVSEKCKRVIDTKNKPTCVLYSYVNEEHYEFNAWQWVGGVVYEGRIDTPDQKKFMHYANYIDACIAFEKVGIPFNIYSPKIKEKKIYDYYKDICTLHPALPYDRLIGILGCHDWGLCGNIKKYREWDLAMPNKLFEYLAGGLPIIALNCSEVAKFVRKHKIGIVVKNVQEIKDRWNERQECQKNVFLKRFEWTMEKHIKILEDLYEKLK